MKKLTLLLLFVFSTTGIFAQHINISLQGGYIFNSPISTSYGDYKSGNFINRGLGVSLQARYQLNSRWEAGAMLEYGAVETLYGLSPTFGLIANRKIHLKNLDLFVGAMGGYLFWQQNESHYKNQQTGYNIGLHAGCSIPLGKLTDLYISAGPRFGKVGTRSWYQDEWSGYYYDTGFNFPVLVGLQCHL
ncbi:MAG: hypothetical protein JST70_10510 [Bacteroidetes bacterium]|nr:hypothetical protein [Bacteroidota bacterium]